MSEQKNGKNPDITGPLSLPVWELLLVCTFFLLKILFLTVVNARNIKGTVVIKRIIFPCLVQWQ